MPIATTIKKDVFKRKMEELKENGFFIEYKEPKPFWEKRIEGQEYPTTITFLVGSTPHKFKAVSWEMVDCDKVPEWVKEFFRYENGEYVFSFMAIRCEEV